MQLAPTARLVPQLFANTNEPASAPVTAMLVIVNAELPMLVMVTDCDPLDVPTVVGAYERLVDERLIAAVTPVPLKAIICGEFVALSVIVTAAAIAPVPVGAKCPWIRQFAPTARLAPQVLPNAN